MLQFVFLFISLLQRCHHYFITEIKVIKFKVNVNNHGKYLSHPS